MQAGVPGCRSTYCSKSGSNCYKRSRKPGKAGHTMSVSSSTRLWPFSVQPAAYHMLQVWYHCKQKPVAASQAAASDAEVVPTAAGAAAASPSKEMPMPTAVMRKTDDLCQAYMASDTNCRGHSPCSHMCKVSCAFSTHWPLGASISHMVTGRYKPALPAHGRG